MAISIQGRKIQGPNVETIFIPRGEGDPIVLKAQAILDMEPFNRLVPVPKPPKVILRGQGVKENPEDPGFKEEVGSYGKKRMAYIMITSLKATEGLVWERIKDDDPKSWLEWEKELGESGFSDIELQRIINGVMAANCLDESKLEEARALFIATQENLNGKSSSPMDELNNMQSGTPANDSESVPQESK